MVTDTRSRQTLTIAGSDLRWITGVAQSAHDLYSVTAMHSSHPVKELRVPTVARPSCAIVTLSPSDSVADVRELLDRSPNVRFIFVALVPPLRHTVAGVIRESGHAIISAGEPPLVVVATVAALMATQERAP